MKNKGFTLVELLAVIVLLGLIALIAVPAITGIIKSGKETLNESQKSSIKMSAKNWASDIDNIKKLPTDGNCIWFNLSLLQNSGYADLEIKDPKNGNPMNPIITISRDNKQLIYEVNPDNYVSCTYISG